MAYEIWGGDALNSRNRFLETLAYGHPDRVPLFEEGIRDEVLRTWYKQGLSRDVPFSSLFQIDQREELVLDVDPHPGPARWPRDQSLLQMLEQRLDSNDPRRLPSHWPERFQHWRDRDTVLMLRVNEGFFQTLGVQDWSRFEEVIFMLKNHPTLVREVMKLHGLFTARLLDRVLEKIQIDAAIFSEPIAGNHGALISPRMFEELVLVGYEPIMQALRRFDVKYLIMRTYANPRVLLPAIVNFGFNCLWACEVPPGTMSYGEIRREFGHKLRLIGGIDVDLLKGDPHQLCTVLKEDITPLIEDGGFVPLADGRVRDNVPFENYVLYRECLVDVVSGQAQAELTP